MSTEKIVALIVVVMAVAYAIRIAPWKRGRPQGPML